MTASIKCGYVMCTIKNLLTWIKQVSNQKILQTSFQLQFVIHKEKMSVKNTKLSKACLVLREIN